MNACCARISIRRRKCTAETSRKSDTGSENEAELVNEREGEREERREGVRKRKEKAIRRLQGCSVEVDVAGPVQFEAKQLWRQRAEG